MVGLGSSTLLLQLSCPSGRRQSAVPFHSRGMYSFVIVHETGSDSCGQLSVRSCQRTYSAPIVALYSASSDLWVNSACWSYANCFGRPTPSLED